MDSSSSSFSFDSSVSSSDLESGYPPPPDDLRPRRAPTSQYALRPRKPPSSPLGRFFCDGFDDEQPSHFLDACFRCRRPIAGNRDIFMYRGDLPFCSVECRQEQIEMDEGKEIRKNWKLARRPSSPRPVESSGGDSPPKSHKTVVAAM
ncbi:FCS-Like Zinc finger 3-like [Curcuma longa]|uniref:FCS-Like Zinc finger 3-like n=1 Tax=Curcuma longa TaxID=136217 RepID=UPI003D9FA386